MVTAFYRLTGKELSGTLRTPAVSAQPKLSWLLCSLV